MLFVIKTQLLVIAMEAIRISKSSIIVPLDFRSALIFPKSRDDSSLIRYNSQIFRELLNKLYVFSIPLELYAPKYNSPNTIYDIASEYTPIFSTLFSKETLPLSKYIHMLVSKRYFKTFFPPEELIFYLNKYLLSARQLSCRLPIFHILIKIHR